MVSFAKAQDLSFDNSSLTLSSPSSMLSEMAKLLKTPYIDGVYFPMPFAILDPKKEEEDDIATSFDLPPPSNEGFLEKKKTHHR